ncbi:hypothetical protein SADUNF_Sadunf07G0076100 [Salix dunnii]|uniref:Uncharacterized protein n=1 Tax=Salix dunnii TaxID=1413687 RepID=A0A835K0X5_9ROSI|nr:hypothetical protein SADUNF_Sadunf07G0076100 [Salix dunnii]
MSDIAILVAEENERRVKNSRKAAGGEGDVEINWVSRASVMAKSIKDKIGKEKTELLREQGQWHYINSQTVFDQGFSNFQKQKGL